ncbi:uncharacterized protein [Diabrotica undecimpunctata]|uniref:uncharacterized protein n=1 Tax=Diabrotica undecimpunctata TaxID=50387 RepID=UPI003B63D1D7
MEIVHILVMLLFGTATNAYKDDLVDPHEMVLDTGRHGMYVDEEIVLKPSFSEGDINKNQECYKASLKEETLAIMYLKRTISLLLSSSSLEQNSVDEYTGSYQYVSNSEEHEFLKTFVNSKVISEEHMRRLDTVLSTLFSKSNQDSMFKFNTCISREDLAEIFNSKFLMGLFIVIGLIVLFVFLKSNYGFLFIIGYFLTVMLIVDYGMRYHQLYEAAEEHNLALKYDSVCDTTKMTWSEYFKFTLSQKDCERKIVTPLEVGLNQLKHIIIVPLESVGAGMGKFGAQLWDKLPFPWNILMFPLMLLFILGLVFLYVLAVKNTSFKLKLLHMFNLELGGDRNEENRIGGPALDRFLQTLNHRPLIEDTRSTPPKEEPKKIKDKRTPKKKEKKCVSDNSPTKDVQNGTKSGKVDEVEEVSSKNEQNIIESVKADSESEKNQ